MLIHATANTFRVLSAIYGTLVLLRLGAIPDARFRHGAWGKAVWAAVVVIGGMGTVVPLGPAVGWWRTTRPVVTQGTP